MPESPRLQFKEEQPQEKVGIFKKGANFYASADGIHAVPVEKNLAENITIALKVQDKVDEAHTLQDRQGLLDKFATLNCRKSVYAVLETQSLRELTTRKKRDEHGERDLTAFELSGIPELLKDIKRITDSGYIPIFGADEHLEIEYYLDKEPGIYPAIVHVFDIKPEHTKEILTAMHEDPASLSERKYIKYLRLNHTFLVLGKDAEGKYVCFHKEGPNEFHRFDVTDMDAVIHGSVHPNPGDKFLTFVGPAPRQSASLEEEKEAA
jgi:hypothetical protein